MIKAVLLDLDDTLITSDTEQLVAEYLKRLGTYSEQLAPGFDMSAEIVQAYGRALAMYAPEETLVSRFASMLSQATGAPEDDVLSVTRQFYMDEYDKVVEEFIRPRPVAEQLLAELADRNLKIVIATNPGLPLLAIEKRMRGGGLNPADSRIDMITSIETMSFGKPQAEYYVEIIQRLGIEPWEALMVGDDIENDISPAESAGLHTYLVLPESETDMLRGTSSGPCGSLEYLLDLIRQNWLDSLDRIAPTYDQFIRQLRVFPATLADLIRTYPADVLECKPAPESWSARDIVCHLRDHEVDEDRFRLERIVSENNPFLSGNYDPLARVTEYSAMSIQEAFAQFLARRTNLCQWLGQLNEDAWLRPARHAVFGPTDFAEMVRFTVEHDRTHLQQMHGAIAVGLQVCGSQ